MSVRRFLLILFAALAAIQPLAADEIADGRKHWAFQPLARSAPPAIVDARARTPVDRFLLARLHSVKLSLSPDADQRALIRRATLDLLGLPPTPESVAEFEADRSPDAYEKLIDRLLASPHFGERWGRHWLDGAGYVDVIGGDNDAATVKLGENKWLYRDYVIRSFNADKPFDRFLTEQLAGDELVDWRSAKSFTPEMRESLIATGFLRTAADDTDENELNTLDIRHGVLQRTGEVLANNLLGLTLNCAKCHDHKYEPLLQKDYYGFLALLQPAFNPDRWLQPKDRQLAAVPVAEKKVGDAHNAAIDKQIAELMKRKGDPKEHEKATPADLARLIEQIADLTAQKRSWQHLQAVYDVGEPTPTVLLRRGDHTRPGATVGPGFPAVLCDSRSESATMSPARSASGSSGRRLALARWLNDADSPAGALVLRVRANRIWQHLFGRGLVESSDNFGLTGSKPTHPELLEWLAGEYLRGGRQLKPFLKLLMTSTAYRQSTQAQALPAADPDNRLLWKMRLRRLESEAVRDSILAVSGKLDRSMGGAPIPVVDKSDGSLTPRDGDRPRRSVYLLGRRNYHPTLLGVFDQPNLTTNCTGRQSSAVVLQSLTMLNDEFVSKHAAAVAERVISASKPGAEIEAVFRLVLGRTPSAAETAIASELIAKPSDRRQLTRLCHVLLNTSEFLYAP